MNDLSTIATPSTALVAGGQIRSLIPSDYEAAFQMAQAIHRSNLAPRELDSPEKVVVAIMVGLEVGLPPMAAINSIYLVKGRPTLFGDAVPAICERDDTYEDREEKFTGTPPVIKEVVEGGETKRTMVWDNEFTAHCTVSRKGRKPVSYSFSVGDAKIAGLWMKEGPWRTAPKRMLMWKARHFALRDAFPGALKGIPIKEDMEEALQLEGPSKASAAPAIDVLAAPEPPKSEPVIDSPNDIVMDVLEQTAKEQPSEKAQVTPKEKRVKRGGISISTGKQAPVEVKAPKEEEEADVIFEDVAPDPNPQEKVKVTLRPGEVLTDDGEILNLTAIEEKFDEALHNSEKLGDVDAALMELAQYRTWFGPDKWKALMAASNDKRAELFEPFKV